MNKALIKILLPLACAWAEEQEAHIFREGVPLSLPLLDMAERIGIHHPDRVRLRVVSEMPMPVNSILRRAAEDAGMLSPFVVGLTLRYGIFIRADCWGDRRLVAHELAHTMQYERLGGFHPFLQQYLTECVTPPGYPFGPLELEAKQIEAEVCG